MRRQAIIGALLALPVPTTIMMLIDELPGEQEQVADVERRVGNERAE